MPSVNQRQQWFYAAAVFTGVAVFFARGDGDPTGDVAGSFKPAASIESLMEGQQQKFDELGKLLQDKEAKNRANRIVIEAELLAEFANVNRHHKDKDDYRAWATQLRDTALELGKEARKRKDADDAQMNDLYATLTKTCEACHNVYQ